MGDSGFHLMDIVFFAMVAAFLVLRLRSVLGRRTGNERSPDEAAGIAPDGNIRRDDNVVTLPTRGKPLPVESPLGSREATFSDEHLVEAEEPLSPVAAGLAQIQAADSRFTAEGFLRGARAAFEMIVEAYAAGERDKLQPLLSDEVFRNFTAAINARDHAGETLQTTLVSFKGAEITEASMSGGRAFVTVKFSTEQVNVTRDEKGDPVEGQDAGVSDVVDLWTFARDTRSSNPNWTLIATAIPD